MVHWEKVRLICGHVVWVDGDNVCHNISVSNSFFFFDFFFLHLCLSTCLSAFPNYLPSFRNVGPFLCLFL